MNNSLSTVCYRNPYNVEPFNFCKKRVFDAKPKTGVSKTVKSKKNKKTIGIETDSLKLVEVNLSELSIKQSETIYNVIRVGIALVSNESKLCNYDSLKYNMFYLSVNKDNVKQNDINQCYVDSSATHLLYKTGAKPIIIMFCAKPVKNPKEKMFWLSDNNVENYIDGLLNNSFNKNFLKKSIFKLTLTYQDLIKSVKNRKSCKKDWYLFPLTEDIIDINKLINIE